MHRELSNVDEAFKPPRVASLYLLTGVLLALVLRDLWPGFAAWLNTLGAELPAGTNKLLGVRYALIAAVIGGARVLYGSLESLFEGRLGADMALAIACVAAILIGEPLVAAEVVLIGLIGECLESFTFARTQSAIRKLAELFPIRCWVLRDGREVRTLVADVQVGDVVVVKPGAKIPVDGVVREGRSAVDASALTGESLPLDKGPGDEVLAGCINQFGALTIEAQRVREQTVAGRVLDMTAKALKDKSPIERHADRLAKWFLPVVLALAALTFIANVAWYAGPLRAESARLTIGAAARVAVYPTLSVLVVACPCALILATPAAVIAALGRLAGTGVLLKSGAALERLAGVTAIAFDKTGTLTEGRLELGDILTLDDTISADELLRLAATAEQPSEHPLAHLILSEAQTRGLTLDPVSEFTARPGAGIIATAAGRTLLVGTRRWLEEHQLAIPADVDALLAHLDESGQTPLLIASEGRILGAIGARDRIRPEAYGVLAELRELGLRDIALLTGDRTAIARRVAAELGIDSVRAELLPDQKALAVGSGQWAVGSGPAVVSEPGDQSLSPPSTIHHPPSILSPPSTAFIGDGINDAPALASATVGLAVGSGAEIAAEAGDVVLMREPLRPLPLLIRLSRRTVEIIRQNIVIFAFGVNLVGVAFTAWLWPLFASSPEWYERSPLVAVIYHQIGSLLVLLNSMRLLAFEREATRASSARLRSIVQRLDSWIDQFTDVDEILHELSHRWKPITAVTSLLVIVGWALSGLTQVGPDEIAIVRRFGRPLPDDLEPGLHWRWPWPIESALRVKPREVRTVEVGYRLLRGKGEPVAGATWLSPHEGEGVLRITEEAQMPTGDGNLVEMLAALQFRISQPRRYLLDVKEPDEILRSNLEAALREAASGESLLDLLTRRRGPFTHDVFERLKERLKIYGDDGLGVELQGLALRDLHPPPAVVPSFHAVAQAAEDHDRRIKDAEAAALRLRREAEGEALVTRRRAEAAAKKIVADASSDRDAFLAWHRLRSELTPATQMHLTGLAAASAAAGQEPGSIRADIERRQHDLLAVQAYLVDFRLTWQALAQTLGQRDKVFIDAENLPGKRHLLLFGPDQLVPPPVVIPSRSPVRGGQ